MFYKIITGDRGFTAFIIFLFGLGIWMPAFFSTDLRIGNLPDSKMPLYIILNGFLAKRLILSKLLAFALVLIEAFMLVRINAKFVLVQQRTFLPALFFIFISGFNPDLIQWNPVLPASIFLILILENIFRSYNDEAHSYRFFDAGILLGLGSLFYAPLIYMLVFIWVANMVQRPFFWREYIFPLLGLMVPYVIVLAFLILGERSVPDFMENLKSEFRFTIELPGYHWIYWIFAIYLGVLIFLASIFLVKVFQFRKIYVRDYFMVLFWLFILTLVVFIFLSGLNPGITYLIAIPITYILTNYFINAKRSLINKLLLYLLIGYVFFLTINNLLGFV